MKLFGLILLLITNIAFSYEGGDRVGNGGDVIVCRENGDDQVYVLDEYESESKIQIGGNNLNYEQKLQILIERVKLDFPVRYRFYSDLYQYYKKNVSFTNTAIADINDTYTSNFPGCDLIQAAYFRKGNNGHFEYVLERGIWNKLNEDQKAILVFHEILYTEAVGLGHTSSFYVRMANRTMILGFHNRAATFDGHFLRPLSRLTRTSGLVIQQLENAYSESIAVYLLELDMAEFYANNGLAKALLTVRRRFKGNTRITNLVTGHLRNIENR